MRSIFEFNEIIFQIFCAIFLYLVFFLRLMNMDDENEGFGFYVYPPENHKNILPPHTYLSSHITTTIHGIF